MTRFVYVADSHLGSDDEGYQLQPKYGARLPEILDALEGWIDEHGGVDFVLHGGDLVHTLSDASLREARALFSRSVPVYLSLGNHDLTEKGGIERWLNEAPEFFPGGTAEFAIRTDDCVIHVVPNHWETEPYYWGKIQDPHLLDAQIAALEDALATEVDKPHLVVTHSPVLAIGTDQTGMDEPFHAPPQSFTDTMTAIAERHGVDCVLGAHVHANMNRVLNGVNYVTVSSLVEAPFEFKLFEVGVGQVEMTTHALGDRVGFEADYNQDQAFVQGRACDRAFMR